MSTPTPDELAEARLIWEAVAQAVAANQSPVERLAQALANTREADGQVIARLRAGLGYYTTARIVTSWGNEEDADDGAVARELLAATPEGQGEALVPATRKLLAALAAAGEAQATHSDLGQRSGLAYAAGDETTWEELTGKLWPATKVRDEALAAVEQARQELARLIADD